VRDFFLSVHGGEIVGVAGVSGNGQHELVGPHGAHLRSSSNCRSMPTRRRRGRSGSPRSQSLSVFTRHPISETPQYGVVLISVLVEDDELSAPFRSFLGGNLKTSRHSRPGADRCGRPGTPAAPLASWFRSRRSARPRSVRCEVPGGVSTMR
jgi:hypothetical protein